MFSEKLKELRKSKNITQEQLADIVGVERSSIGKYESPTKSTIPSTDIQIRIADYFNVSVDYLLGREENAPSSNPLSEQEQNLLEAYRSHPELQDAVNRILYIDTESNRNSKIIDIGRAAAYGGERVKVEITEEEAKRINYLRDKLKDDEQ